MRLTPRELELIRETLGKRRFYTFEGDDFTPSEMGALLTRISLEQKIERIAQVPARWSAVKDELARRGNGTLPENWRDLVAAFSEEDITRFTEAASARGIKAPRKSQGVSIGSADALLALLGDMTFDEAA